MPEVGGVSIARKIANTLAREMGYKFVDAELQKEYGSVFLRIFIEHENGIDLALCEAYHKKLLPLVVGLEYDYLEVSSPGIDRKLKTDKDLLQYRGSLVTIKLYQAVDGQKEFTGELTSCQNDIIELDCGVRCFRRAECALIRLTVE